MKRKFTVSPSILVHLRKNASNRTLKEFSKREVARLERAASRLSTRVIPVSR